MRRYKLKKCPPGMKRCGDSLRCYPMNTVCSGEEKTKEKIKNSPEKSGNAAKQASKHEKKFPWKTVMAGAVGVTIVGASLGYVMTKKGAVRPKPLDFEPGAAPEGMKRYDPTNSVDVPRGDSADKTEMEGLFERESIRTRERLNKPIVEQNPIREDFDRKEFNNAKLELIRENRRRAQNWAREALSDPDTIILDLETTGLMQGVDPYSPETWKKTRANIPGIVQIGMVDRDLNSIDISLNPERKISKEAAAVIGRDPKEFENQPTFKDYYPVLKKRLEGKRVIAFNARFDMQVIDALCVENNLPLIEYKNRPTNPSIKNGRYKWDMPSVMDNESDAMHFWGLYLGKGARPSYQGGKYDSKKGLAFASLPSLPNNKAHDARADCFATYDVLRIMAMGEAPRMNSLKEEERMAWRKST